MQFKPYDYQRYCIHRVLHQPALGLFLDMGLGKTIITLTAINDLIYSRFQVAKVLVIAPKKVAESTWINETKKWDHLHLLRVTSVLGPQNKRMRALSQPSDIYVINRENVPWLVEYYKDDWPFDMVVVDEFSSFKSRQAKRFKALNSVRRHIKRIIGLTGTPAPNGLLDLWAQVYLLDGGNRLGQNITGYRERYFVPDQRSRDMIYTYAPKDMAESTIHRQIADICVSMKSEDYLELPDITYNTIPVYLDKKAQEAYDEFEKEMLLEVGEDEIVDANNAAVLSNKLLQLGNGAMYGEERQVHEIHNNKIEAFQELVEGLNGSPALVFYNFQHDRERIKQALKKTKLRVRELKTPQDQDDWNNREIDILLAHPASAAYGLNLQEGGNHVIWFGLNWSLELYQQANKRLHRQGQKEKVIIHHLAMAGGVDEDVVAALQDKTATQDELLLALKARIERVQEGESA
ncbi:DEAD/DEAH box helicase [Geomicrobium sediminis]|uniref:SNF2 family DNA or RNA helicase n=1 Tax=Geomicrobium sediminis TaxID=1347788 RepID=A0ABS2P6U2_9BACL|nr:DEAD/DEAH box helicase [Geomicrobium sediminis]MBM7631114.1 SNF2 family DNA or RNA helicase [Geomicrobium sediminis]